MAFELKPEVDDQYPGNSNLFIYLKGKRFGEPCCDYPMYKFIDNVVKYYKKDTVSFPELFDCSSKMVIRAIEAFIALKMISKKSILTTLY